MNTISPIAENQHRLGYPTCQNKTSSSRNTHQPDNPHTIYQPICGIQPQSSLVSNHRWEYIFNSRPCTNTANHKTTRTETRTHRLRFSTHRATKPGTQANRDVIQCHSHKVTEHMSNTS